MSRPFSAFQTGIRIMFNLLRAHHHLGYIRVGARTDNVPRALARIRTYLAEVISPAIPSPATATLLRGSATNWLQTNLQILEEHYEATVATTKREMLQVGEFDYQQAWQVAINWMNKKYKPLHREAINRAAEDLEEVGWAINRCPLKQTPLPSSPTLLKRRGPVLPKKSSEGQAGPSHRLPLLRSNRGRDRSDITRGPQPLMELSLRRGLQAPILDAVSLSQEAEPPLQGTITDPSTPPRMDTSPKKTPPHTQTPPHTSTLNLVPRPQRTPRVVRATVQIPIIDLGTPSQRGWSKGKKAPQQTTVGRLIRSQQQETRGGRTYAQVVIQGCPGAQASQTTPRRNASLI